MIICHQAKSGKKLLYISVQKTMLRLFGQNLTAVFMQGPVVIGPCGNRLSLQQVSTVWTSQYHHLFWYSIVSQDSTQFPQVIHSKGATCQLQDTRQNLLVSSKLQTTSKEL